MSRNVTRLTLHKNKIEGREKRLLADDFSVTVRNMIRENDIRCMAFVGISSDGRAFAEWDTGGIVPLYGFPEALHAVLCRSVESSGVEEDYKPQVRGGRFKRRKSE